MQIDDLPYYVYTDCMNLTLSADDRLVQRARAIAQARGTTINEMFRRYLADVTGEEDGEKLAQEFADSVKRAGGRSPEGWKFDRDEAHERTNS